MMVRIRYKTGTVRSVPGYVAKRLVERRIADYETSSPIATAETATQEFPQIPKEPEIDIDALTRDELFALAVERGLDPHKKLGAAKLKAMLQ